MTLERAGGSGARTPYALHVPESLGPELCELLRPGAILERLRAECTAGAKLESCELRHLRAHPGKDAVIAVDVRFLPEKSSSARQVSLYARCESEATFEREVRRSDAAAIVPGQLIPEILLFPELRTVWLEFPNDSRLPHLPWIRDPKTLAKELEPELRALVPPGWVFDADQFAIQILRYKPERRLVSSCDSYWFVPGESSPAHISMVLRFEREDLAHTVSSITTRLREALGTTTRLQVPRVLFAIPELEIVAMEKISGDTLASLLEGEDGVKYAERAGIRIANLHQSGAFSEEAGDTSHRLRDHAETARLLDLAAADLDLNARKIFRRLARLEKECQAGPFGTVHGDFHPEQIVVGPDVDWLLDVEWAGWGDTTVDLGSFCAQLWMLGQRKLIADVDQFRAAFLAGYVEASGQRVDPLGLAVATVTSILELAAKQFRRLKASWPKQVRRSLRECARIFDELD